MIDFDLLREHTQAIWQAGVDAVTPKQLFDQKVRLSDGLLHIGDTRCDLRKARRLVVVGAGKASASMAKALAERFHAGDGNSLDLECSGWVNCPEGTFAADESKLGLGNGAIELCAARPAGLNSPTPLAVEGTRRILELVSGCGPEDVAVSLISGGGSALLVAPPEGMSLADKQVIAKLVASRGGDIQQLNSVRRCLSQVKAGGLARASKAGKLISVIISDVLGDPLETIASGPTWLETPPDPQAAMQALEDLDLLAVTELRSVVEYLKQMLDSKVAESAACAQPQHVILGNNADAVTAASRAATQLGYRASSHAADCSEGDVLKLATETASKLHQLACTQEYDCYITGGEPTVVLPSSASGKGGRNQQLVLAVAEELATHGWPEKEGLLGGLAFLSGGTDGEDGPTDAAGGYVDARLIKRARAQSLEPAHFLRQADAYHFLQPTGGLVQTGPTGTNVCDLRVALLVR